MSLHLLDEVISEILAPALEVTDDMHMFPRIFYLSARTGSVLLYHVVILRSKAQAQALERSLRPNPQLGPFVKMMRIEGGYGSYMNGIITRAPCVKCLGLTIGIWSGDTVARLAFVKLFHRSSVLLSAMTFLSQRSISTLVNLYVV